MPSAPVPASNAALIPRPAGSAAMYLAWLVTAASVLGLLGAAAYAMRLQVRFADLQTRLSQTLVRISMADRAMADARRAAADAQASVAVIASPDVQRLELMGQSPAPGASGRAFSSPTRGMTFVAWNLPPLAEGAIYQVWILTAQGANGAGVLIPDPAGFASTFVTPATASGIPVGVLVTLEPRAGASRPAGPRYLAGGSLNYGTSQRSSASP